MLLISSKLAGGWEDCWKLCKHSIVSWVCIRFSLKTTPPPFPMLRWGYVNIEKVLFCFNINYTFSKHLTDHSETCKTHQQVQTLSPSCFLHNLLICMSCDFLILLLGEYEQAVKHLTNAVLVCGQPQQLLQLFQNTLPPNVFQMLVENLNGLPTGMKEVSEKYLCNRLIWYRLCSIIIQVFFRNQYNFHLCDYM